jgi:hypothetical protein
VNAGTQNFVTLLRLESKQLETIGVLPLNTLRKELAAQGEILDEDKILPPEKIYDFSLIEAVSKELDTAHWTPTS